MGDFLGAIAFILLFFIPWRICNNYIHKQNCKAMMEEISKRKDPNVPTKTEVALDITHKFIWGIVICAGIVIVIGLLNK